LPSRIITAAGSAGSGAASAGKQTGKFGGDPEQGWSLLCNGVVVFADTGVLLPDGQSIPPHRPDHPKVTARPPRPSRPVTARAAGAVS